MIKHPEIRRNVSLHIFSKQTESQRQKFLFDLLSDMITDSYFPFLSKRKMTEEQRIEIEKKINSCVKPNIELWFKDYITGDDKVLDNYTCNIRLIAKDITSFDLSPELYSLMYGSSSKTYITEYTGEVLEKIHERVWDKSSLNSGKRKRN